jgi:tRNA A37 threonylcarbamoyladenosine synthetase subunit TsaC/SUA5/YrdC
VGIGEPKAHSRKRTKPSRKAAKSRREPARGLRLLDSGGKDTRAKNPLSQAAGLLRNGGLVAVCTRANCALFCNASSEAALSLLREKAGTPREPLTIVLAGIEAARRQLA